jgi:hypothetical protein
MPRPAANKLNLKDFPEFPVKREVICSMFTPPLPKSTFYDRAKEGKIIPMPELPGYYLVNASLHRLGLPLVRQLPDPPEQRSIEDLVRLAFSLIDRNLFPSPSWLLHVEAIDAKDTDHALLLAARYRDAVQAFAHVELKLAYFQGVLDGASVIEGARDS